MVINYGFLNYDEPKVSEKETPKTLFSFNTKDSKDVRSLASSLSEDIYENLNGKEKFRFYIKGENGVSSVYQVNFQVEPRDFFESELEDDINTIISTKK